jgi:hypothetical protein
MPECVCGGGGEELGTTDYGDFVTILIEGSMQDNTVTRLPVRYRYRTEYKSDSPLPPLLNVMLRKRVSLRTVKYSLRNTKEKGVVGNLHMYI